MYQKWLCLRAAWRDVVHPNTSKQLTLHPFYSHWWTQWGQTPPRDFPHPAELSFCPAVLPRVWYCKLQPRVSTGGPYSTDNQHLSHAECRVITRKGAQGIPQAADYCSNILHSSRFSTWEIQKCKLWQPTWQNLGKVMAAAPVTALPGSFHWAAPGLCRPSHPWDHHSPGLGSWNTSGFCLSYMRKNVFILLGEKIPHSQGIFRTQLLCLVYKCWQSQDYIRNPNISLCVFQVKSPLQVGEIHKSEYSEKL